MNDFFIHKSLQKNSEAVDGLIKYLEDLKALTNGDLAFKASKDLETVTQKIVESVTKLSSEITQDMNSYHNQVFGLCSDLKASQMASDCYLLKLRRLLKWGWILLATFFISGTGVLCYVAYRVH